MPVPPPGGAGAGRRAAGVGRAGRPARASSVAGATGVVGSRSPPVSVVVAVSVAVAALALAGTLAGLRGVAADLEAERLRRRPRLGRRSSIVAVELGRGGVVAALGGGRLVRRRPSTVLRARRGSRRACSVLVGRRQRLQLLRARRRGSAACRSPPAGCRRSSTPASAVFASGRSRRPARCRRPGSARSRAGGAGRARRRVVTAVLGSSSPPQLRISSTKTMKTTAIALSATRRLR